MRLLVVALLAGALADGSALDPTYARARAKVGEGVAIVMDTAFDPVPQQIGSRMVNRVDPAGNDALAEAIDVIHEQAMQDSPNGDVTLAQSVFDAGGRRAQLPAGVGLLHIHPIPL